jgi:pimeloyl-ACP methyl ester carboxylesterase
MRCFSIAILLGWILTADSLYADGPADNKVVDVRPIPPPGIEIPDDKRQALEVKLKELRKEIEVLQSSKDRIVQEYLPDVLIFEKAVAIALSENGFYEPADIDRAAELLAEGLKRAKGLPQKKTEWIWPESKFTVRGYRSKLDGSIQPYGVALHSKDRPPVARHDVWCRGRSEKGLELQFLAKHLKNPDPLPQSAGIMIHPFGRYCNANKLAGEIDTLEVIEHATKEYALDPKRIAIRGFSMGGAAAWHLAVHYPDRWIAATPGAGFSETPDFLKVFQSESLQPFWFEQKLWQYYDCPGWVRNLRMLPTIAYSGELDKQKQAADLMAQASWGLPPNERFELAHIIAPKTAHQITPAARDEIERRLKLIPFHDNPDRFQFTTYTLRYNSAHWLTIDELREHWVPTTIRVSRGEKVLVHADANVKQFTLNMDANELDPKIQRLEVVIESVNEQGEKGMKWLRGDEAIARRSDQSWGATFRFENGDWQLVSPIESPSQELKKRHMLQGPIDDALMAPFLFVRPTADGLYPETQAWVQSEFDRAVREWHRQMRGDVRIKSSDELKPEDLQNYHLILWGDPKSNPTIAQIAEKLPIRWAQDNSVLQAGNRNYDAKSHVPVLVYPNPLAPDRYVVLNSSFTYREYDYLNNARQVPKLPDWAIIDISTPPNARWQGRIADADFFDERWKLKPDRPVLPK